MTNLQKKLNDLQVVRALPRDMWRRSLEIAGIPDDVIAICLRQRRMTAAQQWLVASERGDLGRRPAAASQPAPVIDTAPAPVPAPIAPPCLRKFGVELECFGAPRERIIAEALSRSLPVLSQNYNHRDIDTTKIVSDSSIRGDDANEVVTPPLTEWDDLRTICESIRAAGGRVNKSCGLHVHLDFSERDVALAQRIGHNYYMLRLLINNSLAPSRASNMYCSVRYIVATSETPLSLRQLCMPGRYVAVNYTAIARHGTIEFRQHQGTLNFAKIRKWIMFLQSLVEWSKDHEIVGDMVRDRADPRLAGLRIDYLRERA